MERFAGPPAGKVEQRVVVLPGQEATQLRGFVLFVEIAPLLGVPDPSRLGNLSRRVQERLRIVGESFGTNFPVYVVFTKSDASPDSPNISGG